MNKTFTKISSALLLLPVSVCSSCTFGKGYDWANEGCNWVCDDPSIIIYQEPIVEYESDGKTEKLIIDGELKTDDKVIYVNTSIDNTYRKVSLFESKEIESADTTFTTYLLSADVTYKNEVLYWDITKDDVFNLVGKTIELHKFNS